MGFRRRCLGFRYKTSFMLIIIGLCAAGLLISYQLFKELSSTRPSGRSVYPALERKNKHFPDFLDGNNVAPAILHRDLNSKVVELRGNYGVRSIDDIKAFLDKLNPVDWSVAPQPDEQAIELKHLLLDLDIESAMSCKEIDSLRLGSAMAQSNRKFVERAQTDDNFRKDYLVISQSTDLETKIACMKKVYDADHCAPMGNYKTLKQLLLLAILKQPNIVELRGYCVRGDGISSEIRKKGVIMVTNIGTPMRPGGFSIVPWRKRLLFAMEMIEFLDYLENNPLGSLALGKISSHDFVLFNGDEEIRLVDFDDVTTKERSCSTSNECDIGGIQYGIECISGVCEGLNAMFNFQKVSIAVLDPLLSHGPHESRSDVEDILENLRAIKLSRQMLKIQLQKLLDKADEPNPPRYENNNNLPYHHDNNNNQDNQNRNQNNLENQDNYNRDQNNLDNHGNQDNSRNQDNRGNQGNQEYQQSNENQNSVLKQNNNYESVVKSDNTSTDYTRMDQYNFPGIFDYNCISSRVAWGCVITCRSLREAKRRCNEDLACKAFVVFSTQPELDTLMTVVLKNSGSSTAQPNPGTTLFVKNSNYRNTVNQVNNEPVVQMSQGRNNNNNVQSNSVYEKVNNVGETGNVATVNRTYTRQGVGVCLRKIFKGHEEPRKSREKRLMAHFGLKGLREAEWQMSVKRQKPGLFSNLLIAKGTVSQGGKFLVTFKADDATELVSKAMFTAEEGEEQYHVAQSIVYHIDRLLGLYHTPPSVVSIIPALVVQKFQKNNTWKESFSTLLTRGNSLKGIYSAPVPHVMKEDKVQLKPLKSMVSNVVKFSRQYKLQFEYVFLWWLAKILKDPTDHIGYKGHMIHFNGDEAFASLSQDLTGYFNHCQFPNIVYKTLNCLRCHNNQGSQLTSVCSLGQEVMKKVSSDKFITSEILLHSLNENDIVSQINDAASVAVGMVDVCIKLFGREQVLY